MEVTKRAKQMKNANTNQTVNTNTEVREEAISTVTLSQHWKMS